MNINISDYGTVETYRDDKLVVTHRMRGDIPNCTPPVHVKTLLEEAQLDPSVSNDRCAELYVKACEDYRAGLLPGQDSWETWKSIVTQIGKIGGIK